MNCSVCEDRLKCLTEESCCGDDMVMLPFPKKFLDEFKEEAEANVGRELSVRELVLLMVRDMTNSYGGTPLGQFYNPENFAGDFQIYFHV